MSHQILIADDDIDLCQLLGDYLKLEGFETRCVHNGSQVFDEIARHRCDLLVLDIMLPARHGLDVLREVRRHSALPVVMLTARGDDSDRILGLELGADDYVPKPCNPRELAARIRAVLRRSQAPGDGEPADSTLSSPPLLIDVTSRETRCNDELVNLTSTEFDILHLLMRNAGKVVDKEVLSTEVLRRRLTAYDRSIDVHISNIRKKLGNQGASEELIKNIRGVGYQFTQRLQATDSSE